MHAGLRLDLASRPDIRLVVQFAINDPAADLFHAADVNALLANGARGALAMYLEMMDEVLPKMDTTHRRRRREVSGAAVLDAQITNQGLAGSSRAAFRMNISSEAT